MCRTPSSSGMEDGGQEQVLSRDDGKRSRRQAHRGCGSVIKGLCSLWESPDSPPAPHTGKTQKRQSPDIKDRTGFPWPSPPFSLNTFTHLDFPLSLAPPRFPVSPGFGVHYLMLTYIQDTSEWNKVCSQFPPWRLNSKGYFLLSLHLNLLPHNFEGKSFSGQVPTKC